MSTSHELTSLQLAVMRVLWARGTACTADVHRELQDRRRLALTTVATLLARLEKKGLVERCLDERPYLYRALIPEHEVRKTMMGEVKEVLFHDDIAAMVNHLLGSAEVSSEDLDRVKALISAKELELEAGHGR